MLSGSVTFNTITIFTGNENIGTGEPTAGELLVINSIDNSQALLIAQNDGSGLLVVIDADGDVLEQTEGTLKIQRPGQFRWSYTVPYEQTLVADGLNVWSYDVDLAQVTVKPQHEALSNTPALLLGGSADAISQFNYETSFVENETTWVILSPKNTDSGFKQVDLGFADRALYRMVFYDNLEQRTLVELHDVAVV